MPRRTNSNIEAAPVTVNDGPNRVTIITAVPPVLFFDDPDAIKFFTRRTVRQLRRWMNEFGLTIRRIKYDSGATRQFIFTADYLACLKLHSTCVNDEQ